MEKILKVFFILVVFIASLFALQSTQVLTQEAYAQACTTCGGVCGPGCGSAWCCQMCWEVPCRLYLSQYSVQYTWQYSTQQTCTVSCGPCINNNQTCVTSSCTTYNIFCQSAPNGQQRTTETCTLVGGSAQWTPSGQSCVANGTCVAGAPTPAPTPAPVFCTSGKSCQSCGAACGAALSGCNWTQPQPCIPQTAPGEPCGNCPSQAQSCVANRCVNNATISGNIFVDTNFNKLKDASESNYTGAITLTSSNGATPTTAAGTYTFTVPPNASYTISYTNLPTGYQMTYPIPPQFTVSVGSSCSVGSSNSASCVNGDIVNLNYGINNLEPWIQGIGASLRLDGGFTSRIPQSSQCGSYASLPGSGNTPGLIFTGSSTPQFGQGSASQEPYNWVVGGPTYPNFYTPTRQGSVIKTSYNYVLARARQGNITPVDIASYCSGGISNCTLSGSIPHGVYVANGSLRLNSFTFPANQNYVILVTGDLTILGKIFVPTNSTALFTASGDIKVDRNVGESSFTSTASSIEGIYSADKSFIVEGINSCTTGPDIRFNVAGSVIANAALSGGSFLNQRNLCGGNVCPAFSVKERADFILNTPDFLKQPNFTYQEIAP